MMPIERIGDWERRLDRQDAFWECAVLDRPVVAMEWPAARARTARPAARSYASQRERWFDVERVVEEAVAAVANTEYAGDALPLAWPNLGPEIMAAFFGVELEYTAETSWAIPTIEDWGHTRHVQFSRDNVYWRTIAAMTDALLDAGRGPVLCGRNRFPQRRRYACRVARADGSQHRPIAHAGTDQAYDRLHRVGVLRSLRLFLPAPARRRPSHDRVAGHRFAQEMVCAFERLLVHDFAGPPPRVLLAGPAPGVPLPRRLDLSPRRPRGAATPRYAARDSRTQRGAVGVWRGATAVPQIGWACIAAARRPARASNSWT